jgi:hypothetical protein
MDVSKLPKLSNTQEQVRQEQAATAAESSDQAPVPVQAVNPPADLPAPPRGADVWISIAIGVVLLLIFPRFLQWLSHRLFGTHFNPFVLPDGTVVPYTQVPEFWSDLGPTLFGIVLIFEGIALALARKPAVVMIAFALTVLATGYNLVYLVMSYSKYGLALVSALAVVFGGYIATLQWQEIQLLLRTRAAREGRA